ncbi:hypothetical protein NA57DRAFT_78616 [Rhizodiscina lignyota]|uniref:Uncharacterized protein n=1 Tax=Rhizodiscina lignyota TaxID=1504668 RepID=A0A9P4IBG6_9PEZI|nr:hypothetical protein NA57DRAFT_78616 [Rhizodiscina lignyota]
MSQNIPRIPLDLRKHKLAIAIPWTIIVTTGCFIPVAVYFGVHYGTNKDLTTALSPGLATFGASSGYNLYFRFWSLYKAKSTCRPVNSPSRWFLDNFMWNFMILFGILTVLISVAIAKEQVRVASLSLSILMFAVGLQMVIVVVLRSFRVQSPFQVSSAPPGETVKSAALAIVEDVVAVDAKQGAEMRALLLARYDASPPIQNLFWKLDLLWGVSALGVAAGIVAIIFAVHNYSVGFAVGYSVPWIWAGLMTIVTIQMVKAAKREEERYFSQAGSID